MVNLGMENGGQRVSLILLSIAFTVLGLFTIISASRGALAPGSCFKDFRFYESGAVVSENDSQTCYCSKGKVVCSENQNEEINDNLTINDFVRSNLAFEAKYFASGVSAELLGKPLGTAFASVVTGDKRIDVQLQQSQLCTETGKVPAQIGLYNFQNGVLTLLNVVNTIESLYIQPCTVTLTYKISKIDVSAAEDFKLVYQTEDGDKSAADICLYNNKVYNDGDNYISTDKCNLCRCVEGVSRCSTDKVCK